MNMRDYLTQTQTQVREPLVLVRKDIDVNEHETMNLTKNLIEPKLYMNPTKNLIELKLYMNPTKNLIEP